MLINTLKRSSKVRKTIGAGREPIDLLSDSELVDWLIDHTRWAGDFDPETQQKQILQIWEAESIDNQRWKITTKRRRKEGEISRQVTIDITMLTWFPSLNQLEELMLSERYGGGRFSVSSTRGAKLTVNRDVVGEPEDPYAPQREPEKKEFKDEVKSLLDEIALRYLKQNPETLKIVALKVMEKGLGIKVPMPPVPDPNAPVPYIDLPEEMQYWLDENPEDKAFYIRRELGLETPEEIETIEDRIVEAMKERLVSDVVEQGFSRPSGIEAVFTDLLKGTNLTELVTNLAEISPSLANRLIGVPGSNPETSSVNQELPGDVNETPAV